MSQKLSTIRLSANEKRDLVTFEEAMDAYFGNDSKWKDHYYMNIPKFRKIFDTFVHHWIATTNHLKYYRERISIQSLKHGMCLPRRIATLAISIGCIYGNNEMVNTIGFIQNALLTKMDQIKALKKSNCIEAILFGHATSTKDDGDMDKKIESMFQCWNAYLAAEKNTKKKVKKEAEEDEEEEEEKEEEEEEEDDEMEQEDEEEDDTDDEEAIEDLIYQPAFPVSNDLESIIAQVQENLQTAVRKKNEKKANIAKKKKQSTKPTLPRQQRFIIPNDSEIYITSTPASFVNTKKVVKK